MDTTNYEELIFTKKRRSLYRQFVAYADKLPAEQRRDCYYYFYAKMFYRWQEHTPQYCSFLHRVVRHDWVLFLHYQYEHTIMGDLRYPLHDGRTTAKLIWLNEKRMKKEKNKNDEDDAAGSDRHLAFCLLHGFRMRVKPTVNALRDLFYKRPFFNTDMEEFLEYAEEEKIVKDREDRIMEERKKKRRW